MRRIGIEEVAGEFLVYLVYSESDPSLVYRVDLAPRDGNGICSCMYFQTIANPNFNRRIGEAVRQGAQEGKRIVLKDAREHAFVPYARKRKGCTECKHLKLARDHFWKHRIRDMISAWEDGWPSDLREVMNRVFSWRRFEQQKTSKDGQ